jgi:uncharacterized protein YcnI
MKTLAAAAVAALMLVPSAFAHAHVTPPVVSKAADNLFALAVPTEEEGLTTTEVELTVPEGFSVDAFMPTPGWKRTPVTEGSGEETVVKSVKWTGGAVPRGEAAVFQFLGSAESAGDYSFTVRQTYSDGKVVNWSGSEDSDTPAPVVNVKSSLGGGGTSTLAIVALVVGGLGLLLGLGGLAAGGRRSGRPLA